MLTPSLFSRSVSLSSSSTTSAASTMVSSFVNTLASAADSATASTAAAAASSTSSTALSAAPTVFVNTCATVAPIAAIVLFAAPMPTIDKVIQRRSVGQLPLLPYSSMVASAIVWTVYGLLKHNPKIWSCNGVGVILGLYYMMQYIRFSSPSVSSSTPSSSSGETTTWNDPSTPSSTRVTTVLPRFIKQHLWVLAGIAATTAAIASTAISPTKRVWQTVLAKFLPSSATVSTMSAASIIGLIGTLLTIGMFSSPLATIQSVIKSKDTSSIPLPFTVASLINCFCWTVTGLFLLGKDPNVVLPNGLGLVCALLQAGVKVMYRKQNASEDDLMTVEDSQRAFDYRNYETATDLPM